ncbi:unnamed protein product [Durusdinium trenchii]|uniref:Uncharacterized protein n=1 Tax=Durusdinium trenchii TaxID=1381693 RepID=A0ABP0HE45_9DINO
MKHGKPLNAVKAALDPAGYGAPTGAFGALLGHHQASWVWETYTRPTLLRSAPPGFGWATAFAEQRRQAKQLQEEQFFHEPWSGASVLCELRSILEALSDRLGDGSLEPELSSADARAYAQLAVLLSIPCHGSGLEKVLADFPALPRYVSCIEERLPGTWPDYSSFLQALPLEERPPPPPKSTFQHTTVFDEREVAEEQRRWFEIWGWSWGGRRQPVQFAGAGKSPPALYAIAFGLATSVSFAVAIFCGLGPKEPLAALRRWLLAITESVTEE